MLNCCIGPTTDPVHTQSIPGVEEKFYRAHELKAKLIADFEDKLPPLINLERGYMDKSSEQWIEDDQDVDAMYGLVNSRNEITIWCEGRSHEHSTSELPSKNMRKRKAMNPTMRHLPNRLIRLMSWHLNCTRNMEKLMVCHIYVFGRE